MRYINEYYTILYITQVYNVYSVYHQSFAQKTGPICRVPYTSNNQKRRWGYSSQMVVESSQQTVHSSNVHVHMPVDTLLMP